MKASKRDLFHLHSRATFFAHPIDIDFNISREKAVEKLFQDAKSNPLQYSLPKITKEEIKKKSKSEKKEMIKQWRQDVRNINQLWIDQMMSQQHSLVESMTLFWHGHFACRTIKNPYTTLWMNNDLRKHCIGNFKNLLIAVAESPAMIDYLHLRQNKKNSPNEDFGRELMELFTLGRDVDYNEKDISEVARAFTGWNVDNEGKFNINQKKHDAGVKTIFGKTGNFTGYDVIDMILENKNCAKFIATKAYKYFVKEKVNYSHVNQLADALYASKYNIEAMMRYLFTSDWFYESQGKLIKSPIHLVVQFGKMFNLKFEDHKTMRRLQSYLGQTLFDPPNVAGWPSGRQWIDSSRLALRVRLGSLFVNKGMIKIELTPELDAQAKKNLGREIKFYEEIDWDLFWKRNQEEPLFDMIIRNNNASLEKALPENNKISLIQLISTPDFQLA